ncbi:MAG: hypothetical protein AAF513_02330 [Pseudomonadota bacterium]
MKKALPWIPIAFILFVFLQSLAFKFSGSQETVIIFDTIGAWMASIGLTAIAGPFSAYGGWAVGITELIACGLLLLPRTRLLGAAIALVVISGAIFFHLFTPLGVDRAIDAAGNTDGGALFFMACGVWISAAITLYLNLKRPGDKAAVAQDGQPA